MSKSVNIEKIFIERPFLVERFEKASRSILLV